MVPGLAALGAVRAADEATLPGVLRELIADPAARQSLAERAAALVDGRRVAADASSELSALADAMRSARYCVIVWEPGRLPPHGALVGEALHAGLDATVRAYRRILDGVLPT